MSSSQKTNTIIPNVSTIFRDLVQISHTNSRVSKAEISYNNHNQSGFDKFSTKNQFQIGNNGGVNDRQKRHNQLMNKLKSSSQQNKELIRNQNFSQTSSSNSNYNYNNNNKYHNYKSRNDIAYNKQTIPYDNYNNNQYNHNQYTNNQYSQYGNDNMNFQGQKKWTVPKIKYRHIEDFQSKDNQNQKIKQYPIQSDQVQLKQQFYGSNWTSLSKNLPNNSNSMMVNNSNNKLANNSNNKMTNDGNNKMANDGSIKGQSIRPVNLQKQANKNNGQSRQQNKRPRIIPSSRQSNQNYDSKLENYYQLIKKPTKKYNQNQSNEVSDKFIRKQVPKGEGINLQKAMKTLMMD